MKELKSIFYKILSNNKKEIEEYLKSELEFGKMVVENVQDKPKPLPIENLAYVNNNLIGTVPFSYVFTCRNFTLLEKLIIQKSFEPNDCIKLENEQIDFNIPKELVDEVLQFYQQSNFNTDLFIEKLSSADKAINDMLKDFSDKCYETKEIVLNTIIENALNKYFNEKEDE